MTHKTIPENGEDMNHYWSVKDYVFWGVLLILQICLSGQSGYAQSSREVIKVTIIPHRSNLGNEEAYNTFFSKLEVETGYTFEWVGSKTYDDVIRNIKTGKAEMGYVGPFAYVDAQDSFGVRLICRTLSEGSEEFYHSMIVTRANSGIQNLQDLKGRTFAFTDPKSTSGYLFPMTQLKKSGISLTDFSDVRYLKRHANSLLAVYLGDVDAGATSVTAVDKVDINMDELKIIWKSEPIYRGPWIAGKDMSDDTFEKIKKAMLKIGQPGRLENDVIFKELTTKGFVEGKDSDYDNIREVIQWMENQ